MIDFQLLKAISEIPGAPGFEKPIRDFVLEQIRPLADEVYIDSMGSIVAIKKGAQDKKVMVAAHMDEISFVVSHIDDEGFVRFHTLGGFDPKTLTAQRVIIHGKEDVIGVMGSKPIHIMTPDERNKAPQTRDYFIDTGYTAEKLKELIYVGAPITRERELIEMGDCVNGKSLDNRVSVYILIETFKALQNKEIPYDLYGVFTVQEEVGLRGAINAAGHINPDFGLGLDVTIAFDVPGAQGHEMVTRLGYGAGIKILDGSSISDYRMVEYLKKLANEKGIKWQAEVLPKGGTDTAGVQRYGKDGSIAGAISIPLRHIHQVIEMAHKEDISACINLLTHAVSNLDQHDWSF